MTFSEEGARVGFRDAALDERGVCVGFGGAALNREGVRVGFEGKRPREDGNRVTLERRASSAFAPEIDRPVPLWRTAEQPVSVQGMDCGISGVNNCSSTPCSERARADAGRNSLVRAR